MKQFLPLLCFILLYLSSCMKNENPEIINSSIELVYKTKLYKLLNAKPIDNHTLQLKKDAGVVDFKFNSYKEAYNYFKFLESKKVDTLLTIALPVNTSDMFDSRILTTTYGVDHIEYSASINSRAGLSGTFGTGSVNALYQVYTTIGYAWYKPGQMKIYTSKNIESSSTSGLSLFYSGAGTATGTAYITSSASSGSLIGNMQGVVTLGGTSFSFIINLSGGYTVNPPPTNTPVSSVTVTHWLSAYIQG